MASRDPDGVVHVQLDDDDDLASPDDPSAHAAIHPRRRRALWWTGAGVLVALVVAVVAVNVVDARRAADRRAELAATPWVLPTLGPDLEEAWRVEGSWVTGETSAAILVTDPGGGLNALDPGSGEVLWRIPIEFNYCWTLGGLQGMLAVASVDLRDLTDIIVCDGSQQIDETGRPLGTFATYDGVTGELLATVRPEGSLWTSTLVGRDYVVASTLDDGTIVVTSTDMRTGASLWEYRSEPGRAEHVVGDSVTVSNDDDVIVFDGPEDLVLSRRTGAELDRHEDRPPTEGVLDLGGGTRMRLRLGTEPNQVLGRIEEDDGTLRFEFEGWPWLPSGVGGSSASGPGDVFVVQQPVASDDPFSLEIVGLDARTGAELWRRPDDQMSGPLMALDGVGVMSSATTATGLDLRTGEDLWTHKVDPTVSFYAPVTDGDVVLLPFRTAGTLELVAVDLRTGEDQWRMAAPPGLSSVAASAHGLMLLSTSEALIAYRP